jgi:hypothetical protein
MIFFVIYNCIFCLMFLRVRGDSCPEFFLFYFASLKYDYSKIHAVNYYIWLIC